MDQPTLPTIPTINSRAPQDAALNADVLKAWRRIERILTTLPNDEARWRVLAAALILHGMADGDTLHIRMNEV
jgi:hypothetical protein